MSLLMRASCARVHFVRMRDPNREPMLTDLGLGRTGSAPRAPTHGHRSTLRVA
jgi:hypothetical protein